MYHYLKWSLLKKEADKGNSGLDKDAENLIIEINRTTERNLQLMEAKIAQIKDAVKDAERVVSVINREKAGNLDESEIYRKLEARSFYGKSEEIRDDVIRIELPGGKKNNRNIRAEEKTDNKVTDEKDIRKRAVTMYKNGIEIELISKNLNIPTGEIELMISLDKAGRK